MNISITIVLIIANVALSFYAWNNAEVWYKWTMNPYSIAKRGEYYRFVSSGFIHADYGHLFFNMFALYGFGQQIESVFISNYGKGIGQLLYLGLYFGALIVSDIPTYLKNINNVRYNSVGASGAVSGVIFASVLLYPFSLIGFYFIPMPAIVFAILYIIYSKYMENKGLDNVNHSAHLYGGYFGVFFTILVIRGSLTSFFDQLMNWQSYLFK
jgi:membrane associated rhomboid family serine protease